MRQIVCMMRGSARRSPPMIPDRAKVPAFVSLVVILVFTYARAFSMRRPSPPAPPSPVAASGNGSSAPQASDDSSTTARPSRTTREAQRRRAATLDWRRDPFILSGVGEEAHGLHLSGILWDPAKPLAIIDGQTVQVGDQLGEYRITSIDRETVTISNGTATTTLHLTR